MEAPASGDLEPENVNTFIEHGGNVGPPPEGYDPITGEPLDEAAVSSGDMPPTPDGAPINEVATP